MRTSSLSFNHLTHPVTRLPTLLSVKVAVNKKKCFPEKSSYARYF